MRTASKYNSYADADFQKNALNMKVVDAPFFASPRKPALHHTMDGLTIDTSAHMLDTEGNVIHVTRSSSPHPMFLLPFWYMCGILIYN